MAMKKDRIKKILNVPNKIVDKTLTIVATPVIMGLGVKLLKKKTGVSTRIARREMKSAIIRRLKK